MYVTSCIGSYGSEVTCGGTAGEPLKLFNYNLDVTQLGLRNTNIKLNHIKSPVSKQIVLKSLKNYIMCQL